MSVEEDWLMLLHIALSLAALQHTANIRLFVFCRTWSLRAGVLSAKQNLGAGQRKARWRKNQGPNYSHAYWDCYWCEYCNFYWLTVVWQYYTILATFGH